VQAVEFDDGFLIRSDNSGQVNLSRFAHGHGILAGDYLADIYLNDRWQGKLVLALRDRDGDDHPATVCASRALLDVLAVDLTVVDASPLDRRNNASDVSDDAGQVVSNKHTNSVNTIHCVTLEELIPGASSTFDPGSLRLSVEVPQIALQKNARGDISPEYWDAGVTAATIDYNANVYRTQALDHQQMSSYLGLNNSAYWHGWHLHHQGAFSKNDQGKAAYQSVRTYIQHDIVPWKSQLIAGQGYTSGQLFDSVGFTGLHLVSDERMLPDSQSGYAPVIRGIAHSHAKVNVSQRGMVLYEMTVAPGTFEITDLYATGDGGDLLVTIHEASGEVRTFTVATTSQAMLLRANAVRYSATVGQTRDALHSARIPFAELVAGYGVSNAFTAYWGMQLAPHYVANALGLALSTSWGAWSLELLHAQSQRDDQVQRGYRTQLKYSKQIAASQTMVSLSAYRYTGDRVPLQPNGMDSAEDDADGIVRSSVDQALQFSVSQPVGQTGGALFMNAAVQRYRDGSMHDVQYGIGYSHMIGNIAYAIAMQKQQSLSGESDHQLYVSLSVPLGRQATSPSLMFSHSRNASEQATMATVSGKFNDAGTAAYSITAAQAQATYGALSAQYRAPYALMSGSYSRSADQSQMSASASGAVVMHPQGVTLSQTLGESVGVLYAPDAAGAQVNTAGIHIDKTGHAVVPSLTPYRANQIDIDPKGLPVDVELQTSSQQVVPHAGAVVMLDFPTRVRRSVLIDAVCPNGSVPPFGAQITDEQGQDLGLAGQGGRLFVRGLDAVQGQLTLTWGEHKEVRCRLSYRIPETTQNTHGLRHIQGVCMPVDD
jgi:outer membrane usher protein